MELKSKRIQEKCILALRKESLSAIKFDFHELNGYNIHNLLNQFIYVMN